MRRPGRMISAALITSVLAAGLGALSRVPYYGVDPADSGVLRLSWRLRGERVQECRHLTPAELEALPIHMRRPEVCEGRVAPFRLRVWRGGEVVADTVIGAAGAREDRPIYVFREFVLPAGDHRIAVTFTREVTGSLIGSDAESSASIDLSSPRAVRNDPGGGAPRRLSLDTMVTLRPGRYALITYDATRRALILRTAVEQ